MNLNMPASKKLSGLVIAMGALLVLTVLGIIAVGLWGVPWEMFASMGGFISSIAGMHQGAQAAADRSPYYNPPANPGPSNSNSSLP